MKKSKKSFGTWLSSLFARSYVKIIVTAVITALLTAVFISAFSHLRAFRMMRHGMMGYGMMASSDWRSGGSFHANILCSDRISRRSQRWMGRFANHFSLEDGAQTQAWDRLSEQLAKVAQPNPQLCQQLSNDNTTPQEVTLIAQLMSSKVQQLEAATPAFEQFYNTLNAEQRQDFDSFLRRSGKRHGKKGDNRR